MDSSTSTQNKEVLFVLGRWSHNSRFRNMTHREQFYIVAQVIKRTKPVMKYLSEFAPIADHLRAWVSGRAHRITEIQPVFPHDITEKTKVKLVIGLEVACIDSVEVRKDLLITDDGTLLLWSAIYELVPIDKWESNRVARESRFEIFDEKLFLAAAAQPHLWKLGWPSVLHHIICVLSLMLDQNLREREGRLRSIRETGEWVRSVYGRLEV